MSLSQRNLVYPFVVIGVGVLLLLSATDVLPEAIADLMERSWSMLIVIIGLNLLFAGRVRFGNWLALGLSAITLGIVIFLAYEARIEDPQDSYTETLNMITLGDHIQGVDVQIKLVNNTTVTLQSTPDLAKVIGANFVGSKASEVSISAQEDDNGVVTLTITEHRPHAIPKLEDVGRGELVVTLPVGVPITNLTFSNERGRTTLDLRALDVPRMNVQNRFGDVDLWMPFSGIVIGDVIIDEGNLQIVVLPEVSLRVTGSHRLAEYNQNVYIKLDDGTIRSENTSEFEFNLRVSVPKGTLTVISPEEL